MFSRFTFARIVQAGFFVSGAVSLVTVYFGLGGIAGMAVALATTMPFSFLIMFGMRCKSCGVSFFFDPSSISRHLTGVNLLRPVERLCPKCGAVR